MPTSSRSSRRRAAAVVVLLALLTAGCQARLAVDIAVDRDGAGEIGLALGADAALLAEAEAAGADPLGDLATVGAALRQEGWRMTDERHDDGGRTVTVTGSFASPQAFAELSADLVEALAAPELAPLRDLRLEVTEEAVRVSGVAALVPGPAVTDLGLQPEQAVALLRDTDGLVLDVAVRLPGEVLATTASGGGDGEPLSWRVQPGEEVEILAVSTRPGDPWWLVAAAAVAGGAILLGLLALARRRRRRRQTSAAAAR